MVKVVYHISGINSANPRYLFGLVHTKAIITMSKKRIVTVVGATGVQGGSIINALLKDADTYIIRGVTRTPWSESAKALFSPGRINNPSRCQRRGIADCCRDRLTCRLRRDRLLGALQEARAARSGSSRDGARDQYSDSRVGGLSTPSSTSSTPPCPTYRASRRALSKPHTMNRKPA